MATCSKELCDICYNQHITAIATVFCSECDEKLCERCSANHSVARLSRKHECITLHNVSKLPQFVQDTKLYCIAHEESYEYFCSKHDEPCCTNCLRDVHSECHNMSSIQNTVKDVKFSSAFYDFENMLSYLINTISNVIDDRRENLQELKKQKIKFRKDIRAARASVNVILGKMEDQITMNMNKEFSEKESEIKNLLEKFEKYRCIINKSQECIHTLKMFASDFQSFMAFRKISENVNCVEQATRKVFEGNLLTHIEIAMESTVPYSINSNFHSLGQVNVKHNSPRISLEVRKIQEAQLVSKVLFPVKIPYIQIQVKFSVKLPCSGRSGQRGEVDCFGCCTLGNDDVIISDSLNKRLVILNNNGELKKQLNLSFVPLGLAYLKGTQIIIVAHNKQKLIIFGVENGLLLKTVTYNSNFHIKSISMKDNEIIVQNDSYGFSLLDLDGTVKTKTKGILSDTDSHEALCIKEQIYYVANDGLCCCDMKGDEIWKFQHLKLRTPFALTSNGSDILFTTDFESGCVFAVGTDGKLYKILTKSSRHFKYVSSMYFNKDKKQLVIVTVNGNIFLFDVANKNA
ncbi:unnamed protein product [Mytilus coruscus]|uniref:B box-type domain-containing protein n=1 Tax=Mytilus coruscus TaxID=42192 RepID=A0A6J8F2X2_MYTCO|nr:unnamed protein product [Mytilus coruscus]